MRQVFSRRPGQAIEIEVRPAESPDGYVRVLVQIPDGFVLIAPAAARHVADQLNAAAIVADLANE